ncbi:MAG: metallophosphoesterase [Chloroflexota bacterium]|nr:metallophosphoesterase [Chloroflexota bacterium]
MKLAIIADIHGNIHALDAVLRDIDTQDVDQIIVNGDLVNRGPNNVAVMERIMPLADQLILGNHDDLVRKWVDRDPDLPEEWFDDPFWKGTEWTVEQLAEAGWIDALRDIPMTHKVTLPDTPRLIISHGSPRHYREGYGNFLRDEQISEIVQMYPYDILIGSHTHRQMVRRWGTHVLLNTGAVGAPFNRDPRAQYLLIMLRDHKWEWEFHAVEYDREAALDAFQEMDYLAEGGLSAHIFWEELLYARAIYAPYWMWAETREKPMNWRTWQEFRDEYGEHFFQPVTEPVGPPVPDRPDGSMPLPTF